MSYILRGRLRGYVSPELLEPLSDIAVKLYRIRDDQDAQALAAADPKHTFAVLTPEQVREKDYAFFAQTRTNAEGEFTIDLSSKTIYGHRGATHVYGGELFELDVYCTTAQGYRPEHGRESVQFTAAVLQPDWQPEGEDQVAYFEYDISQRYWCEVRAAMDVWVITGRVTRCGSDEPLAGVRVHAFDADLMQDDDLGSAVTDEDGRFRIDFMGQDFRDTGVRGVNYEAGGPDLYFRIEAADGRMLLSEAKDRGSQPDRDNVGNCFHANLCVENPGAG